MPTPLAEARSARLLEAVAAAGLDLLLVYGNAWQNDYLRYVCDFGILEGQALALLRADGHVTLYLDSPLEVDRAEVECAGIEIVHAPDLVGEVDRALDRFRNQRVGSAPHRLIPRKIAARREGLSDATALIDRLLMAKLVCEVDAIRRAARLADEGYAVFRAAARPGRADYELIAEVEAFYRAHGVDDNFQIIGVGGPEVRGMAPPGGKRLKRGDLVTTELTPCVEGYYAQICRTLVVGRPSDLQLKSFAVFQEALDAGLKAVRADVTAADVAKAENDVFRQYGLGQYVTSEYTRVRGHGLGLFPDQKPQLLEDVDVPLTANMTIIVHPNTYHPDVGYLVLGDTIIVTADGHETLSTIPRSLLSS